MHVYMYICLHMSILNHPTIWSCAWFFFSLEEVFAGMQGAYDIGVWTHPLEGTLSRESWHGTRGSVGTWDGVADAGGAATLIPSSMHVCMIFRFQIFGATFVDLRGEFFVVPSHPIMPQAFHPSKRRCLPDWWKPVGDPVSGLVYKSTSYSSISLSHMDQWLGFNTLCLT